MPSFTNKLPYTRNDGDVHLLKLAKNDQIANLYGQLTLRGL